MRTAAAASNGRRHLELAPVKKFQKFCSTTRCGVRVCVYTQSMTTTNDPTLNAQLVELAERVIEVTPTFVMVDKQQTAQQRRAHEPITQVKRWGATVKIAGMTSMQFGEMFGLLYDIRHFMFDGHPTSAYTKAKAIDSSKAEATEEFILFMSRLAHECERWGGDTFLQAIEHLNNYTTKVGN